jgi:hypothetical protein
LMHAERPELMDAMLRSQHDLELARRVAGKDEDVPWLAIPKAIADLDEMLATASGPEVQLLTEHRACLVDRLRKAMLRLPVTSTVVA